LITAQFCSALQYPEAYLSARRDASDDGTRCMARSPAAHSDRSEQERVGDLDLELGELVGGLFWSVALLDNCL
jgi:hypothetical protein